MEPKKYRPVAILPVLSKVLERIIFDQILAYLIDEDLLHPNQHAYRARHNTTTALIQMHDDWINTIQSDRCKWILMLQLRVSRSRGT